MVPNFYVFIQFLILQTKFLSGWLKCHDLPMEKVVIKAVGCRQQDETSSDCGIFVALWCECFVRDSEDFWEKEAHVDIKGYRARMTHDILHDEHSILQQAAQQ